MRRGRWALTTTGHFPGMRVKRASALPMGLWDSLRGLFGGRPSAPQPQPSELLREWRFADDREWSGRTLDAATLQVYADWLEEQGDARHELIRLAPTPEQFRAFVDANTAALFGSLAKFITWPDDRHRRARSQLEPQWEAGVLRGLATLGSIEAPELTHFTLETSGLTRDEVKAVIAARWPRLEHLELWFGDENYGCDCAVADVEPLLHANFPSLKSLGLRNFNYVEGLVPRLAATPLIRQLERLDLSMGTLDDEGAEVLLSARSAFAHLRELDLSDNYLSGAQFEPLSKLCASVTLGKQRDQGGEQRYVSVTE